MSNGRNVSDQQMSWWSWRKCLSSGGGLKAMAGAFCSLIYGATNDACWFWRLLACTNTMFCYSFVIMAISWSTVHFVSCSSLQPCGVQLDLLCLFWIFLLFFSQWECRGVRSDTRDSINSNWFPVWIFWFCGWWILSPYKACGQLCGFLPIGYWFIVFIFNRMMDLLHFGCCVWFFFFKWMIFLTDEPNHHLPSTDDDCKRENIFGRKR